LPHLNSEWFPGFREEKIKEAVKDISETVYALDDESAIKIAGENVEVISEGKWVVFNKDKML